MPLYDYTCGKCGSTKEYLVPSADAHHKNCLGCNSTRLTRVMSERPFSVVGDAAVYVEDDKKPKNFRENPSRLLPLLVIYY